MSLEEIKRCELCGCPLEYTETNGSRFVFTAHTADFCGRATAARIKAMQQMLEETLLRERATYESMIELGKWVSTLTRICETGRRWIAGFPNGKMVSASELEQSGGGFTASSTGNLQMSPAASDLYQALQHAISQVEIQNKRT
jgi:hypothetical protein